MAAFAALADVIARYPQEATVLAADETTRLRDDARITTALADASAEIRGILFARYTPAELGSPTPESAEILSLYCIDIALYRVALSFGRSNERVKERYDAAIARLTAIAAGKGALTFEGTSAGTVEAGGTSSPGEVLIDAPERLMTRDRLKGW